MTTLSLLCKDHQQSLVDCYFDVVCLDVREFHAEIFLLAVVTWWASSVHWALVQQLSGCPQSSGSSSRSLLQETGTSGHLGPQSFLVLLSPFLEQLEVCVESSMMLAVSHPPFLFCQLSFGPSLQFYKFTFYPICTSHCQASHVL